jgi:hypothetical protein
MHKISLIVGALVVLAACSAGQRPLHDLSANSAGPDEFSVVPVGALEIPDDLGSLPAPTPGQGNLTDPDPIANAAVALGGRAASVAGGVPARDAVLVAKAARYGVTPTIRADLAAEDATFRGRRSATQFFNLLGSGRYFSSYASQRLDAYAELARFRDLGVKTPSAPPLQ